MYVSSRQGYKPPVKSTGRGEKDSHFASLKYCNGAETFYTYDPQRGKAGGQMAHTNTYGTDTGKKFQLANIKDVIGDFASYGSDPRRTQYAGSETDGFSVDYKVIEFSLAKLQLITPKRISTSKMLYYLAG